MFHDNRLTFALKPRIIVDVYFGETGEGGLSVWAAVG